MTAAGAASDSVRGRYTDGVVEGQGGEGFVHDGEVETFVALRAWIDNWRWTGVPFTSPPASAWPRAAPKVVVTFAGDALAVRPPAARTPRPTACACACSRTKPSNST